MILLGEFMIKKVKFYISDTFNPYINLAKEKVLFDGVDSESIILYLWQNQNTVVIGKNQNAFSECRVELLKKEGGTLARRLSGGGAVFHDLGNLNFTFICSTENLDIEKHLKVIQTACLKAGIDTEISGRNDILSNGKKFSGNAFYNSKGKSYHHGTILINANFNKLERYLTPPKAKLEAKGVKSVKSRVVNLVELSPTLTCDKMKEYLISSLEEIYNLKAVEIVSLNESEVNQISESYKSWEYLYGKQLPFNAVFKGRLSFGNIEIQMQIEKGIITAIKFYTDSLDTEISKTVEEALTLKTFELTKIQNELEKALPINQASEILNLLKEQLF